MAKSRDAFRTISEVSEALDTPTHVLRFWESKFSQIKPVKRAGGRRYYRPDDIDLLAGIKTLLHDHGMTIKGAQKLLREQGVKHVSGLAASDAATAVPESQVPDAKTPAAPEPAPSMKASAPLEEPQTPNAILAAVNAETHATPPTIPSEAGPQSLVRTTILAEVAAPNEMMVSANAEKIAALLARLEKLRDAMRAA